MPTLRRAVAAGSLVVYPLLILTYFALTPAYGILSAEPFVRAFEGHADRGLLAVVFAFASAFVAIPASLALMALLRDRSPKLALLGGSISIAGWVGLVGALMADVVAATFAAGGLTDASVATFVRFANGPIMIAFNALAAGHIVGAVLLGAGLWRTRVVPLWAAVIATFVKLIHFGANVSGLFWLDAATWLALIAAYATAARVVWQSGGHKVA